MMTFRGGASCLAILLLISSGLAGCSKGAATEQPGAPGGPAAGRGGAGGRGRGEAGPVPVTTTHAVTKAVPIVIPAVGTAEPLATVQVRAQVNGQLGQIHFTEGQDVKKGQLLFTLDSRPFEASLNQAEAVLARDTAQSKNAESQRQRAQELFDRGLIPRDQYETQAATATALEATLAADRSQVENARINLAYARITAPISGRTGALNVHQGDLVRANDTQALVVINQVAPIYVSFSVPGRFLPEIRVNQARKPLRVEARGKAAVPPGAQQLAPPAPGTTPAAGSDDDEDTILVETGAVSFIDNAVDPSTGTIKLKGTFENADHALWPGLFVQISLVLATDPTALVIPAAAVQASQTGQYVYVVKADQTAEMRPVTVERQQGEEAVIAKGLTAGEEVVTDGHLRITPGARVSIGRGNRGGGREAGAPARGPAGEGRRGDGNGGAAPDARGRTGEGQNR